LKHYSNTVATNKTQTLNSLNRKVFKSYKDNKLVGTGNRTVESASHNNTGHLLLRQHLQNLQA